jgi:RNA 3'-terminal phosphate cyclase (ATP)/RNA 3'-terminal phosphate cyclase (GTP)
LIEIDGGHGEGGGQILRMAVAFSAITGKHVRILNIRANRPKSGLANQHLTSIRSVAELCNARVEGLHKGSGEVDFCPGELSGGDFRFDIGTAGSVTLVLQACLIPALVTHRRSTITITGGTDVRWSPPWDYFEHVFLPVLKRLGGDVTVEEVIRGYYPRGGGRVHVSTVPCDGILGKDWTDLSTVERIDGFVHVGNLPDHILRRMETALEGLKDIADTVIRTESLGEDRATGQGGAVVLGATAGDIMLGSNALAERGVKAEKVARNAAESLIGEIEAGATADIHLSDQILPYLAIADKPSTIIVRELTSHTKTHMWLLEKFLDVSFDIEKLDGKWRIGVQPSRTWRV